MFKPLGIIALVMLLITQSFCWANSTSTIVTLAAEDSWPPYANEQGEGISHNIIQSAFNAVGIKVKFVVAPYARALRLTEQGQVHGCFNVTKQSTTLRKFRFGDQKLFDAPVSFYFNKASLLHFDRVEHAPDGMTVGVIIGYEYGDIYLKQSHRFTEVKVSNQKQLIGLLRAGKVQTAIMFDKVAEYTLQQMGLPENVIVKGPASEPSEIFVAFSKSQQFTEMDWLINQFDQGMRIINQ
ncbi:substrate-binding periplasmic protein [Neptunicella sp. SCSIO 80796]|uniref:substrate-binding periplasmic protein n=1 Tax=Neptunicella plasticusilytica TaxID=3117012 RepID=UPI003A4D8B98